MQLYKANQGPCEKLTECILDMVTPQPAYVHDAFSPFRLKMVDEGCGPASIGAFRATHARMVSGGDLMLREINLWPIDYLPTLAELDAPWPVQRAGALLRATVMVKLNGDVGTEMGLDTTKALLPLKGADTFLDFAAKQVAHLRKLHGVDLAFVVMNSFATSAHTMAHLAKYDGLAAAGLELELTQNKSPKIDAKTGQPAACHPNPELDWAPPGHGDLYAALSGSGMLDRLLESGMKYMFVSEADNCGATLDLQLLSYFADTGAPFLMECVPRTAADTHGGHLARDKDGAYVLREATQCVPEERGYFEDWERHKFLNTNNLWVDLAALKGVLTKGNGALPLRVMKLTEPAEAEPSSSDPDGRAPTSSQKPRSAPQAASNQRFGLRTAAGAAIECFPGAKVILSPRSRFSPIRSTADLLVISSDAYEETVGHRMVLKASRRDVPPIVRLDALYRCETARRGGKGTSARVCGCGQ